jgi:hypothetical protein
MARRTRLALIAIREAPGAPGVASEAIIVGTADDAGTEWRYVCCALADLGRLLEEAEPFIPTKIDVLFHDGFDSSGIQQALGTLTGEHAADSERAFDEIDKGKGWLNAPIGDLPSPGKTVPRHQTAIVFTGIITCFLYRRRDDLSPSAQYDRVLARLDTCSSGAPSSGRESVSSTLVLFPDRVDAANRGLLRGVHGYFETRLAANGHTTKGDAGNMHEKDPARHDPRALLRLVAVQSLGASAARSLFKGTTGSILADSLQVGLTRQSWLSGGEKGNRIYKSFQKSDVIDACEEQGALSENVETTPIFHDLVRQQLLDEEVVTRSWKIDRTWGFRKLREVGLDLQLGFRFEAAITDFLGAAGPMFERLGPGKYTGPRKAIAFAQEQRVGDITTKNLGTGRTHWLLTVRVERESDKDLTRALMKQYDAIRNRIHSSLRTVRDALPLSVLPAFDKSIAEPKTEAEPPWHVVGQIVELESWRRRTAVQSLPSPLTSPPRLTRVVSFEPMPVKSFWKMPVVMPPLKGLAEFSRLTMTDRRQPTFEALVGTPRIVDADAVNEADCIVSPAFQPAISEHDDLSVVDIGTRFSLELTQVKTPGTIDVGALRFRFAQKIATTSGGRGLRTGLILIRALPPEDDSTEQAGVDAFVRFPVDRVDPAGQDDLESAQRVTAVDRRSRVLEPRGADPADPLMFEIGGAIAEAVDPPSYTLSVSETVTRDRNHTVSMTLRAVKTDTTKLIPRLVLALHPEPFRVAAVEYVDPASASGDEGDEVAVWNAAAEGGLSWRVLDQTETVRMLLPPQVIGEATEKNLSADKQRPADIDPGAPADARFGAPTRVEIDPTFADAAYREPGWNLRRILGHAGQRQPGSRLRDLRLELLYGMTTRVSGTSEVWLSELSGIVGAPALTVVDTAGTERAHLKRHIELVNRVIRAERHRIAVDKVWKTVPASDLTLEERVMFALRTRRVVESKQTGGPVTKLRWPVPGEMPSDASAPVRETFGIDRESFPGGVAWAFESANILMSVYRNTASDGGRAQGLHLSAHGGYGGQRALFDEKRTVVETDTTQGRVQRYRLERIGRIGALWHRAKHVIVYERTVVPSAQFVNRLPIGVQQDEHAGRPILRKLEEFVELIQPKRIYPEDGTSIAATGCLVGAEFKSKKIRVDSRWGSDVRREGWQVPLWNKAFAALTPDPANPDEPAALYPKPQIVFLAAGEGTSTVELEVSEPEKLVFYTSVVHGESGDNTDAWRPVRDVDFVDLPLPVAGKLDPQSKDLTDATLPPEPRQVPGFERLTIGIAPAKLGAAIAHGRQANGPVAVLKNMTITRAAAVTPAASVPRPAVELGPALASVAASVRAEMDRAAGRVLGPIEALDPGAVQTQIDEAVARGLTELENFKEIEKVVAQLKAEVAKAKQFTGGQPCERLRAVAREQLQAQAERLNRIAVGAIRDAAERIDAPLASLAGSLESRAIASTVKEAVKDLQKGLADKADIVIDGPRRVLADAREAILHIRSTVKADVSSVARQAGVAIDDVTHDILRRLEEIRVEIEGAPAAIKTAPDFDKAVGIARRVQGNIDKVRQQIRAQMASGPPEPVKRLLTVVDDALRRVNAAIDSGIINAGTNKDSLAAAVDVQANAVVSILQAIAARISALSTSANSALKRVLDRIEEMLVVSLDAILGVLADAEAELAGVRADIIALDPTIEVEKLIAALTTLASRVRGAIGTARGQLQAAEQSATAAVGKLLKDEKASIDKAVDQIAATCAQFEGALDDAIQNVDAWLDKNVDIAAYKADLKRAIQNAQAEAKTAVDELKRRATAAAAEITREVEGRAREFVGAVQQTVREAIGTDPEALGQEAVRLYQQGSETLRLVRAVGDPPRADSLGFNRPEVAYVLNEVNRVVDMTPAIALVNRAADTVVAADQAGKAVGDLLQSFGVRLPASRIGEQLVPDRLKNLSVSSLMPDMAGLDFRGLLQRAGFPDLDDSNAIRIRHGFDKAEMRAWLEADIDVPFAEPATLVDFGPVQIVIDEARFVSNARIAAGRDGNQRTMKGRISGDWRVVCGGMTMLTFRQTGLHFDDSGRLDFRIQPEKVELAAALQFLTSFLKATGKKGELVIEPFMRGGVPAGVAATLDMELPPVQLGVFGISDLSLHVLFGIAAIPQFEIVSELSVSTKLTPFTLNVWILNGGGFLTQRLSFLPMAKPAALTYTLEVGIVAGVGIGFSFGVVSGGVWLQVGCSIAITWTTRAGGNTTAISVFILARGNVDVAGLITAGISLLLEVTYDGAAMIGNGTLCISVNISVFFTLSVKQRVQYLFAGEKREAGSDSYAESQG